ncbi:MAG: 3-deoxy-D-manno-octulosonic acid transferase [Desulfuromonadales bacterium]|nr:3-deoxy-D-manno-octulosonic acid transferase [Desulfuromonadales bacterium]
MYVLYNLLLFLAFPFIITYHVYRSVKRKRPIALKKRLGFIDKSLLESLNGVRPILVHAVSVGETIAVKPLLTTIKKDFPNTPLMLSNMTETGHSVAQTIKDIDLSLYFPFDFCFAVKSFLKKINPKVIIVMETELWPNFLKQSDKMGIPVLIVNGRISDNSFRQYMRFRKVFSKVLNNVTRFCMQSGEDAERIKAIGALPEKVVVTRNLKYDIPLVNIDDKCREEIRVQYRIPTAIPLFTAASTHEGEEEVVLKAFSDILNQVKDVVLVLVPRHPERCGAVAELIQKSGFKFVRRSKIDNSMPALQPGEILLLDTVGELLTCYSISDVVFVGGSLVPNGGHNLLEPAACGIPVLFGPYMDNFREITDLAVEYNAAEKIYNKDDMVKHVVELLNDSEKRKVIGERGKKLLQEQGGATVLNMKIIAEVIGNE